MNSITKISSIPNNYNTLNLQKIYDNHLEIKSRIYTKQRILTMLNKKKILINKLNYINEKIKNYESYLSQYKNKPNLLIYNRLNDLKQKLTIINNLLIKIEWEENLILSTLPKIQNSSNNFFNILFKYSK